MKDHILQLINEVAKMRAAAVQVLTRYLKDVNQPLEERWVVFEVGHNLLPVHDYVLHLDVLDDNDNFSWHDDFNLERCETEDLVDVVDRVITEQENSYNTSKKLHWVNVDQLKEEILQCGYGSFVYDW